MPMVRMRRPGVLSLFEELPVGPAQQGEVEVTTGEAADLAHDRGSLSLAAFHLVGDKNHFRDQRHVDGAERVVAHGGERVLIGDRETLAEDGGGYRAVEEDGIELVNGVDGDATFPREAELLNGRMSAEEVVAQGGELDAVGVEVPSAGKVQGFDEDAFDVANEAGRAQEQLVPDRRYLVACVTGH